MCYWTSNFCCSTSKINLYISHDIHQCVQVIYSTGQTAKDQQQESSAHLKALMQFVILLHFQHSVYLYIPETK